MLQKNPKPAYRRYILKSAKILLVAEALAFGVTYALWYRFNSNRDLRYYSFQNYPWALEAYYSLGETANSEYKGRETDLKIWKQEGKL